MCHRTTIRFPSVPVSLGRLDQTDLREISALNAHSILFRCGTGPGASVPLVGEILRVEVESETTDGDLTGRAALNQGEKAWCSKNEENIK